MRFRAGKNRRSKGKALLCLLLLCLSFSLPVAAAGTGTNYHGVTGNSELSYVKEFDFRISLNPEWFVHGDNTVYFSELARVAAVLSNAIYGADGDSDMLSGTGDEKRHGFGRISGDGTSFLTDLGFLGAERISVTASGDTDMNDITELLIGHMLFRTGDKDYEIVAVCARGSVTAADWISNADVGADTEAYTMLTGEHPEWTDRSMHKGFAVTANRSYEVIEQYMEEELDPDAEKIIFLTGHSRGAAVANILGTFYEDREDVKSFTYTFASPRTTTADAEKAASYSTVFNVINEDDIVPELPAENWGGFKRYGTDLILSGDSCRRQYKHLVGESYLTADGLWVTSSLAALIDSREALYEIDGTGSYVLWDYYDTEAEAEEARVSALEGMEEDGVAEYFRLAVNETEEDGETRWELGYTYRPAYLIRLLAEFLSLEGVRDFLNLSVYEFSESYSAAAAEFIVPVADGSFLKSHMPAIYYCLTSAKPGAKTRAFIPAGEYFLILLEQWWWLLLILLVFFGGFIALVSAAVTRRRRKKRPAGGDRHDGEKR